MMRRWVTMRGGGYKDNKAWKVPPCRTIELVEYRWRDVE